MFGKYEVLSILGSGSFGTVYLSKHLSLECFRALKLIPKSSINSQNSLISEALLLKSLEHPAIPHVYDLEEDTNYYYLIEEYIKGDSLETFLSQQSFISQQFFLEICIQLCDIFRYLHTLTPNPMLYLDLKPEHIIVCGTGIKLIDFNVATFLSKTGNILNLFGNQDFSAPELSTGAHPDITSDIYSIGKIMQYLSSHLDSPISPKLHQIITKAIQQDPSCRYETVDSLLLALQSLSIQQSHLCKKIAIFGSHAGCGATHIAISMVSTLNFLGYSATYYDKTTEGTLCYLPNSCPFVKETNGLLSYKFFRGYPNFGPGICLPQATDSICVYDYGTTIPTEPVDADHVIFVFGNSLWQRHNAIDKGDSLLTLYGNLQFICNMGHTKNMRFFAKYFHSPINEFPYTVDPFCITQANISTICHLLKIKRRKHLFFHFGKRPFKKR